MCDRLATAAELAEILGVPVSTVYDRARRSGWPSYRIGHAVRWNAEEILTLCRREGGDADRSVEHDVAARVRAGLRGRAVHRRGGMSKAV